MYMYMCVCVCVCVYVYVYLYVYVYVHIHMCVYIQDPRHSLARLFRAVDWQGCGRQRSGTGQGIRLSP